MTTVNSTDTSNPYAAWGKTENSLISGSAEEQASTFLKLLTTQLQNQDPLNPMENAEFTSQLAQLNTVQGINNLNTKLESFAEQFASAQVLQAVAMLDRQVLVEGNSFTFDGQQPVTGGFATPNGAETATVTIYNSEGKAVDTITLNNLGTQNFFEWDGTNAEGTVLGAGTYSFTVTAASGGLPVTTTPMSYARVESVERGTDGSITIMAGGNELALSDIREII